MFDDRAEFRWTGGGPSYQRRTLSQAELKELKEFVLQEKVDSWPKLNDLAGHNCEYQYLHLLPTGGYRVYMWNPSETGDNKRYRQLTQFFKGFLDGPMELRYRVVDETPGARIVLDSSKLGLEVAELFGDAKAPLCV